MSIDFVIANDIDNTDRYVYNNRIVPGDLFAFSSIVFPQSNDLMLIISVERKGHKHVEVIDFRVLCMKTFQVQKRWGYGHQTDKTLSKINE